MKIKKEKILTSKLLSDKCKKLILEELEEAEKLAKKKREEVIAYVTPLKIEEFFELYNRVIYTTT